MESIKYVLFDTKSAKMFHRSTEIFMQGGGEKKPWLGLYIQLHRKGLPVFVEITAGLNLSSKSNTKESRRQMGTGGGHST
jgi:hypothetical protein